MEMRIWWAEYHPIYKDSLAPKPSEYYMIKGKYASSRKAKEAAKQQLNKKESANPKLDHIRIKSIFDQEKAKEKFLRNAHLKFYS
jgi:hypothetical protein